MKGVVLILDKIEVSTNDSKAKELYLFGGAGVSTESGMHQFSQ